MKRYFSIWLIFLFLVSHLYLTIGTHFCCGETVEQKLVLGKSDLHCGMSGMDEGSHDAASAGASGVHVSAAPCCEDVFHTLEPTDEFVKEFHLVCADPDFAATLLYVYLAFDQARESTQKLYSEYSPPWFEKDYQPLFQTFLI